MERGTGEAALCLRALAAFQRTLVRLPGPKGWPTHIHNSGSRKSDALLWPNGRCAYLVHRHADRQDTHTCKIKVNKFLMKKKTH